jgi:3-hydroxyisobutyrate dehydrogenase
MKISVLGTGLMGAPLAMRLLGGDYSVFVWNRTPEKAEPLVAGGAELCTTPADAIAASECVILMLSDVRAIVDVLFSDEAREAIRGKTVIQMGTIEPRESRAIGEEVGRLEGVYLEAPVLGSTPEAKKGELLLMVGADKDVYTEWLPVLRNFGKDPLLVGPVGQGAAMKLGMNQLIASLTSGFALSLGLVRHEGVPVELFMDVLRNSALYAPTFDKKLDRMMRRDFSSPNFPLKHLDKDVKLFLKAAAEHPLGLSGLKGVEQLLERAILEGMADEDYSAIYDVIDRKS